MNRTVHRGLFFVLAGLVLAVSLPACRQAGSDGPVAAQVGEQKITLEELKARLRETPAAYQQYVASAEGRRQFLNLLIREKVVLSEASRLGIPRDPAYQNAVGKFKTEEKRRLKEYEERLQVDSAVRRLRAKDLAVTDANVEKYFNDHRPDYARPIEVTASHILLNTAQDAQAALERLKAGQPFAKVAQEMSKDPVTAARGGKLAPFQRGTLVPEFEDAAFRLKVGQVSGVVKSQFGFHIIKKVGEKRLASKTLTDVKEEIRSKLERDNFNQWVTAKQAALGIQVNEQAMSHLSLEEPSKP